MNKNEMEKIEKHKKLYEKGLTLMELLENNPELKKQHDTFVTEAYNKTKNKKEI